MSLSIRREPNLDEMGAIRFDLPGQLERIRSRLDFQSTERDYDDSPQAEAASDSGDGAAPAVVAPQRHQGRFRFACAMIPMLVAAIVVLAIPSVRSFAEEVLVRFRDYFFERSVASEVSFGNWELLEYDHRIAETVPEMKAQADFAVRALPDNPYASAFMSALVFAGERELVIASYRGERWTAHVFQQTLADAQSHGALSYPLGVPGVADSASIQTVRIGEYSGEQVHGSWAGDENDPMWSNELPVNRVRWSDEVFVYSLELRPASESPGATFRMPSRRMMSRVAIRLVRALME